ncbi:DUF3263 domain-containing protein [Micrococcus cohnii]|uniref:DUF3263 domain-containing protein n=1 Tax=Micrococcus cohnii TaxID=993416 RepID=A0A7W7GJS0_9MICC|nr:DUF3263 domain-containing protein [Micrococcus cohnii]MBB4734511.1 hypothetical protein [Micrococcus cohnii]
MSSASRDQLSEQERAILRLEEQRFRYSGAKDRAIRDRTGLTPTAYYQVLNALLDRQASMAYRPLLVQRLRAMRGTRRRAVRPSPSLQPSPSQEN